jgi:DNA mismatch endonuclease (patch repair protein)
MADIVSPEKRSLMMAGIRGKNTKPELIIRRGLHRLGYRFRLHDKRLPGKPDIVLPKYRAVIQVQGCFWHGHECHLFKLPSSRPDFWKDKITGNKERDARNLQALEEIGWRVLMIWECALRSPTRLPIKYVLKESSLWLEGGAVSRNITGRVDT